MPSQTSFCNRLLPMYYALGRQIDMTKECLRACMETGDHQNVELFDALALLSKIGSEFFRETKTVDRRQMSISYQSGNPRWIRCTGLDFFVLETIEKMLAKNVATDLENGRFIWFSFVRFSEEQMNIVERAMPLLMEFSSNIGLDFRSTKITSLPSMLPNKLVALRTTGTSVSALPTLREGIKNLDCSDSLLASLPDPLPESLKYINIQNTPALQNEETMQKLEAFTEKHSNVLLEM